MSAVPVALHDGVVGNFLFIFFVDPATAEHCLYMLHSTQSGIETWSGQIEREHGVFRLDLINSIYVRDCMMSMMTLKIELTTQNLKTQLYQLF